MILNRILTLIETGVADPSFTREADIMPLVNEFVEETSNLFNLPDLQAQEGITVSSGDISIEMPVTFSRELYRVYNDTFMRLVSIRTNVAVLEGMYDPYGSPGAIKDVAQDSGVLWVKPNPIQDQELSLFFYRKPVPLEFDDDDGKLDGIPDHLSQVAVDYVLMRLFTLIEDGIEGRKVNTEHYTGLYSVGLAKIEMYCKQAPKKKPKIKRSARFI